METFQLCKIKLFSFDLWRFTLHITIWCERRTQDTSWVRAQQWRQRHSAITNGVSTRTSISDQKFEQRHTHNNSTTQYQCYEVNWTTFANSMEHLPLSAFDRKSPIRQLTSNYCQFNFWHPQIRIQPELALTNQPTSKKSSSPLVEYYLWQSHAESTPRLRRFHHSGHRNHRLEYKRLDAIARRTTKQLKRDSLRRFCSSINRQTPHGKKPKPFVQRHVSYTKHSSSP